MPNRPTLKTIGQLAGLSHVAVSKALRDAPDISAATKERVRKIAEELGYTPNVAARNLYLQRTSTIGMVVPAVGDNTAYDLIFNEVSAAAAELEFCVMLGSSHRSLQLEERHCRMMVGNQVGAIIVASCTSDVSHINAACGSTPVIFIGGKTAPEEPCALLCDYRRSGALAVEHLTGLGHREIVLLTYEPENLTILQKEAGFTQSMEVRGLIPRMIRTGHAADAMRAGMDAGISQVSAAASRISPPRSRKTWGARPLDSLIKSLFPPGRPVQCSPAPPAKVGISAAFAPVPPAPSGPQPAPPPPFPSPS